MGWSSEWKSTTPEDLEAHLYQRTIRHEIIQLPKEDIVDVPAVIVGDLAVHCGDEVEHYITHMPTKAKFDKALPSGSRVEKDLIVWCQTVQIELEADWNYLRDLTEDEKEYSSAQHHAVKDRILKHCRMVKLG